MTNGRLKTATEVIDALGGLKPVAQLTDRSVQQVWGWKDCNEFPAKLFLKMTAALQELGMSAPSSLWQQDE